MTAFKVEEISLKIENEFVIFIEFIGKYELILICENGNVYYSNTQNSTKRLIGKLGFQIEYSEKHFAYSESIGNKKDFLQVNFYKNYVCVVQKYGQHGIVFNLENPEYKKILFRGDYCVEQCVFPISFYEKDNQIFLIYGTDWNRLDITCLETDVILTNRIVDYDTNSNYFDYFHSSLLVSPDAKHFTSNGWHWHPFGQVYCFPIDEFLGEFELKYTTITLSENPYNSDWDKPLCWVNEETLAIGFNKNIEEYGETKFPNEILFINIIENTIVDRIEFDGFTNSPDGDVRGNLFFDKDSQKFIGLNPQTGLLISDINGKEILREPNFTSHKYSAEHKLFYQFDLESQLLKTSEVKLS